VIIFPFFLVRTAHFGSLFSSVAFRSVRANGSDGSISFFSCSMISRGGLRSFLLWFAGDASL